MKLTVVMIVKNEEAMLENCLQSVQGADEIVICDTGSEDNTVAIAKKYTDNVYTDYTWEDSFAKARNHALSKVPIDANSWILSIDADERLEPGGIVKLRAALTGISPKALTLDINVHAEGGGHAFKFPRVFKRSRRVFWKGAAHNHLSVSSGHQADVNLFFGYSPAHALDPDRTLRILSKYVEENPDCVREKFYLAREYMYKNNLLTAIMEFRRYVQVAYWGPEWAEAYYLMAICAKRLNDWKQAKKYCLQSIGINANNRAACLLMAELSGPKNKIRWTEIAATANNEDVLFNRDPIEQGAAYYDAIFAHSSDMSRYEAIHQLVGEWATDQNCLDIGCGTAELQHYIKYYHGIDFSAEAVKIANKSTVTQADIYTADLDGFETYIICEVLEHVDDKKVLARIPKGKKIILSVPSFPDPSHVRTYTEASMYDRLSEFVLFNRVIRFNWDGQKWVEGGEDTAQYILVAEGLTI